MAFVDDDQVEEVRAEFAVGVLVLIVVGQTLIQRQIDLVGFVDLLLLDDRHFVFEVAEIASACLVDQGIPVRQKQDALFRPSLPQSVNDLKGGIGFTGTGGHCQQDALLTFGNGLYSAVDGNLLVVAGVTTGAVEEIILSADSLGFWRGDAFVAFIPLPELFWRWKVVQR